LAEFIRKRKKAENVIEEKEKREKLPPIKHKKDVKKSAVTPPHREAILEAGSDSGTGDKAD